MVVFVVTGPAFGQWVICDVGEFYDSGAGACAVCPSNTYSAARNASVCTPCPTGATTQGSTPADHDNPYDCLCSPGSGRTSATANCAQCQAGSFGHANLSVSSIGFDPSGSEAGYTSSIRLWGVGWFTLPAGTYVAMSVESNGLAPQEAQLAVYCGGSPGTRMAYTNPFTVFSAGTWSFDLTTPLSVATPIEKCGLFALSEIGPFWIVQGNGTLDGTLMRYASPTYSTPPIVSVTFNSCCESYRPHITIHTADACEVCPTGEYSAAGVTSCDPCPANTTNSGLDPSDHALSASCECKSGLTGPPTGPCTACGPGLGATGGSPCTVCDTGFYSPAPAGQPCTACPANSNTSGTTAADHDELTDCECSPGYTFDVATGTCPACPAGTFYNGAKVCEGNVHRDSHSCWCDPVRLRMCLCFVEFPWGLFPPNIHAFSVSVRAVL
jgi:Tyrosine-protein kinase ephrin type A/B receptor-like